jgi:hypothetical protein
VGPSWPCVWETAHHLESAYNLVRSQFEQDEDEQLRKSRFSLFISRGSWSSRLSLFKSSGSPIVGLFFRCRTWKRVNQRTVTF